VTLGRERSSSASTARRARARRLDARCNEPGRTGANQPRNHLPNFMTNSQRYQVPRHIADMPRRFQHKTSPVKVPLSDDAAIACGKHQGVGLDRAAQI
jgi:hypothetical protein